MQNDHKALDKLIGKKQFTKEDQLFFAALSGDVNPIHMDPVFARKYFGGKNIVHGMHLLLWALNSWLQQNQGSVFALRCHFKNPVSVGDTADLHQGLDAKGNCVLRVSVAGLLCAKITLAASKNANSSLLANPVGQQHADELIEKFDTPRDVPVSSQLGKRYQLLLGQDERAQQFGQLCLRMGSEQVMALAALSAFVGMICPGLHSILASIEIAFARNDPGVSTLCCAVEAYDDRFKLVEIAVSGVLSGYLTALGRPPPVCQPALQQLGAPVMAHEFSASRALIIGGSRGLGAFAAKALVAGGGSPVLTYAVGKRDAESLAVELNDYRRGCCQIKQFDVRQDPKDYFSVVELNSYTSIYFFATPRIFVKRAGKFNQQLFNEFFEIYVTAFYRLVEFCEQGRNKPLKIFLPSSSVVVADTVMEWTEYAAAKRCAEQLADAINHSYQKVMVLVERLPRLDTDQTASLAQLKSASTADILLPVIRAMEREVLSA